MTSKEFNMIVNIYKDLKNHLDELYKESGMYSQSLGVYRREDMKNEGDEILNRIIEVMVTSQVDNLTRRKYEKEHKRLLRMLDS